MCPARTCAYLCCFTDHILAIKSIVMYIVFKLTTVSDIGLSCFGKWALGGCAERNGFQPVRGDLAQVILNKVSSVGYLLKRHIHV
eukprot:scaffold39423_cov38-Prasinocladus_malaysianus.AAC.1